MGRRSYHLDRTEANRVMRFKPLLPKNWPRINYQAIMDTLTGALKCQL